MAAKYPEMSIEEIEAAVRAEMPELLERARNWGKAAAEPTVSGALRRSLQQLSKERSYHQIARDAAIDYQQLCDFMAGVSVPSDAVDRLADVASTELVTKPAS